MDTDKTAQSAMVTHEGIGDRADDAGRARTEGGIQEVAKIDDVRLAARVGHVAHAMVGDDPKAGAGAIIFATARPPRA